ncbi:MAG: peptidoglycan-associated lipoprotein [Burkholderiales bacterium]|jgi:peptidoglycan-associated lipoprotein
MRTYTNLALILSSAALLAACGSNVKLDDKAKIEDRSGTPSTAATSDTRTVAPLNAGTTDPLNDPKGVLAKRSVYFDYDSYTVKDEFKPVVEAHAKYLAGNKGRKIIIQGNTDERGGREYNLALGQKRAEAVRKSLSLLGVPETQMEAVSLGKEKPKATGSDEAAWSENRRSDIVY